MEETSQCATIAKFVSLRLTSFVDLVPQSSVHQQILVIHPPSVLSKKNRPNLRDPPKIDQTYEIQLRTQKGQRPYSPLQIDQTFEIQLRTQKEQCSHSPSPITIATVLISARGGSLTCARNVSFTSGEAGDQELVKRSGAKSAEPSLFVRQKRSWFSEGRVRKTLNILPHRGEHPCHCTVCSVFCHRSCVAGVDPVYHDCSHKTLCARCFLNEDNTQGCCDDSSSSLELVCVTEYCRGGAEHEAKSEKGNETSAVCGAQRCLVALSASEASPCCRESDHDDSQRRSRPKHFLPREFVLEPGTTRSPNCPPGRSEG